MDGDPGHPAHGGRDREARPHGGAPARAGDRPGRARRGRRRTRCVARAPAFRTPIARSARSCSSGPTGVGKTELARALAEFMFDTPGRDDPDRHVRVHGEALRLAAGRRASRLRRLRRGRPADRGGPPASVRGGAARRDREGPPRRVQHAAAGDGRRAPDRRPGPHGRLQEHGADHDLEHSGGRRRRRGPLQARVRQPARRHRRVRAAEPRADRRDRRPPGRTLVSGCASAGSRSSSPTARGRCSATSATTRPTARGR